MHNINQNNFIFEGIVDLLTLMSILIYAQLETDAIYANQRLNSS